jgi:hypothetical protein
MSINISSSKIVKGLIAGFVATVVLTILMMMKKTLGVMPELDPVHMLSEMAAQNMGMEPNIMIGWIMHFMIGSVAWGGTFIVLNNVLPGTSQIAKGISLGIVVWFMMMIGPMPMSGAGLFGLNMGILAPVMTFMLHIVFGVVLGAVFIRLGGVEEA